MHAPTEPAPAKESVAAVKEDGARTPGLEAQLERRLPRRLRQPRTYYQITHRDPLPRTARALEAFEPELQEYIDALLIAGPMERA